LSNDKNLAVSNVFDSAEKTVEVEEKNGKNLFQSPSKNDSNEIIENSEIKYQLDS